MSALGYTVTFSNETLSFDTRKDAIDAAKDRSKQVRGEVTVADESGAEVLTYRHGELASYLWDDRR